MRYNRVMYIYLLGREAELCLAELESKNIETKMLLPNIVMSPKLVDIKNLGGTIKIGEIISDDISNAADLQTEILNYCKNLNLDTKFSYGISSYGSSKINVNQFGIKLKKKLKEIGIKPRYVAANEGSSLNAASIKHNKLTTSNGREFIVVNTQNSIKLAVCLSFQDVDSYSKRDYEKPCRDRKVGMLPPKLSQIMINLAQIPENAKVVDPFCGSGGLLMEASLMGYSSIGSDISKDMIDCSKKNTAWLKQNFDNCKPIEILPPTDATNINFPSSDYSIVTEGFLGTNFLSKPTLQLINEQKPQLRDLYLKFFENINLQDNMPQSICISLPFWVLNEKVIELNLIDEIADLGYTISEFKSVRRSTLSYHREGQFTGRQIVVFKPNKEK